MINKFFINVNDWQSGNYTFSLRFTIVGSNDKNVYVSCDGLTLNVPNGTVFTGSLFFYGPFEVLTVVPSIIGNSIPQVMSFVSGDTFDNGKAVNTITINTGTVIPIFVDYTSPTTGTLGDCNYTYTSIVNDSTGLSIPIIITSDFSDTTLYEYARGLNVVKSISIASKDNYTITFSCAIEDLLLYTDKWHPGNYTFTKPFVLISADNTKCKQIDLFTLEVIFGEVCNGIISFIEPINKVTIISTTTSTGLQGISWAQGISPPVFPSYWTIFDSPTVGTFDIYNFTLTPNFISIEQDELSTTSYIFTPLSYLQTTTTVVSDEDWGITLAFSVPNLVIAAKEWEPGTYIFDNQFIIISGNGVISSMTSNSFTVDKCGTFDGLIYFYGEPSSLSLITKSDNSKVQSLTIGVLVHRGVDWIIPSEENILQGVLGGYHFTVSGSTLDNSTQVPYNLYTPAYAFAPGTIATTLYNISSNDNIQIHLDYPFSHFALYVKNWTTGIYTFNKPFIVMGSNGVATMSSNWKLTITEENVVQYGTGFDGILYFLSPISVLTIEGVAQTLQRQFFTFGVVDLPSIEVASTFLSFSSTSTSAQLGLFDITFSNITDFNSTVNTTVHDLSIPSYHFASGMFNHEMISISTNQSWSMTSSFPIFNLYLYCKHWVPGLYTFDQNIVIVSSNGQGQILEGGKILQIGAENGVNGNNNNEKAFFDGILLFPNSVRSVSVECVSDVIYENFTNCFTFGYSGHQLPQFTRLTSSTTSILNGQELTWTYLKSGSNYYQVADFSTSSYNFAPAYDNFGMETYVNIPIQSTHLSEYTWRVHFENAQLNLLLFLKNWQTGVYLLNQPFTVVSSNQYIGGNERTLIITRNNTDGILLFQLPVISLKIEPVTFTLPINLSIDQQGVLLATLGPDVPTFRSTFSTYSDNEGSPSLSGYLSWYGFNFNAMIDCDVQLTRADLTTTGYSVAPGSVSQTIVSLLAIEPWNITFNSPVENLFLYAYHWAAGTYVFNQNFTIITSNGEGIRRKKNLLHVPENGLFNGILVFTSPVQFLKVDALHVDTLQRNGFTFATLEDIDSKFLQHTSPSTGLLIGAETTFYNVLTPHAPIIHRHDFETTNYQFAPSIHSESISEFFTSMQWRVEFTSIISGLLLYTQDWAIGTYFFSQPIILVSGTGAIISQEGYVLTVREGTTNTFDGILLFLNPVSSLLIRTVSGTNLTQTVTFAVAAPSTRPLGVNLVSLTPLTPFTITGNFLNRRFTFSSTTNITLSPRDLTEEPSYNYAYGPPTQQVIIILASSSWSLTFNTSIPNLLIYVNNWPKGDYNFSQNFNIVSGNGEASQKDPHTLTVPEDGNFNGILLFISPVTRLNVQSTADSVPQGLTFGSPDFPSFVTTNSPSLVTLSSTNGILDGQPVSITTSPPDSTTPPTNNYFNVPSNVSWTTHFTVPLDSVYIIIQNWIPGYYQFSEPWIISNSQTPTTPWKQSDDDHVLVVLNNTLSATLYFPNPLVELSLTPKNIPENVSTSNPFTFAVPETHLSTPWTSDFATFSTPQLATLDGYVFTLSNVTSGNVRQGNFSTVPMYDFAPSDNRTQSMITYSSDSPWSIETNKPLGNMLLYIKDWTRGTYTFNEPFQLVSGNGQGAMVPESNQKSFEVPQGGVFNGILLFPTTFSYLIITFINLIVPSVPHGIAISIADPRTPLLAQYVTPNSGYLGITKIYIIGENLTLKETNLSSPDYNIAPSPDSETVVSIPANNSWSMTIKPMNSTDPVNGLLVYLQKWDNGVYHFNHPITVLSGNTNSTTQPNPQTLVILNGSSFSGVLLVNEPIYHLKVDPETPSSKPNVVTFALDDGSTTTSSAAASGSGLRPCGKLPIATNVNSSGITINQSNFEVTCGSYNIEASISLASNETNVDWITVDVVDPNNSSIRYGGSRCVVYPGQSGNVILTGNVTAPSGTKAMKFVVSNTNTSNKPIEKMGSVVPCPTCPETPCQNDAICVNGTCVCTECYFGRFCQYEKDPKYLYGLANACKPRIQKLWLVILILYCLVAFVAFIYLIRVILSAIISRISVSWERITDKGLLSIRFLIIILICLIRAIAAANLGRFIQFRWFATAFLTIIPLGLTFWIFAVLVLNFSEWLKQYLLQQQAIVNKPYHGHKHFKWIFLILRIIVVIVVAIYFFRIGYQYHPVTLAQVASVVLVFAYACILLSVLFMINKFRQADKNIPPPEQNGKEGEEVEKPLKKQTSKWMRFRIFAIALLLFTECLIFVITVGNFTPRFYVIHSFFDILAIYLMIFVFWEYGIIPPPAQEPEQIFTNLGINSAQLELASVMVHNTPKIKPVSRLPKEVDEKTLPPPLEAQTPATGVHTLEARKASFSGWKFSPKITPVKLVPLPENGTHKKTENNTLLDGPEGSSDVAVAQESSAPNSPLTATSRISSRSPTQRDDSSLYVM